MAEGITFNAGEILELLLELNPSMRSSVTMEIVTIHVGSHFESLDGAMAESATETPGPASESSIKALRVVSKEEEEGKSESDSCPICLDMLFDKDDMVVKEMPCRHRYHTLCIEKWLHNCSTCPLCRYKLPQEEEEKREEDF